ncbi:DUF1835 domain-containing protein [Rufibacter hautae]|uniref:DUF1835 domain-containing protein n=1 Tax=Rufibacter hautae TaxID=2595005 RepID=A0A5B6TGS7_9BACT|nr:DUF1835 domain-containing protein [Rufibacter hautae]KAA3438390.1 DUF1835 domain-containing protein [Rufibacter hautae]
MVYHILNGDALTDRFKATGLGGQVVVTRECLVDGDLSGDTLPEFFQTRARYINAAFQAPEEEYATAVVAEMNHLLTAPNNSEFNLWFGYDLFCRANMWFILSLLQDLPEPKVVNLVYPANLKEPEVWRDFGGATTEDLRYCYEQRITLSEADLTLGRDLWLAFKQKDLERLKKLSELSSPAFPYLREVCQAHLDRFPTDGEAPRPERVIREILQTSAQDFPSVFRAFSKKEGIYGFGDAQLKRIYDKVVQSN